MTEPTSANGATTSRARWQRRLAVVAAAIGAGVAVYLLQLVLGQQVHTPELPGMASAPVRVELVVLDAAGAAALGWALLAILERFTRRAHLIWRVIAVIVLLLSLSGPFSGTDVTITDRLWLSFMHVAVAAVLIVLLPGPARSGSRPGS